MTYFQTEIIRKTTPLKGRFHIGAKTPKNSTINRDIDDLKGMSAFAKSRDYTDVNLLKDYSRLEVPRKLPDAYNDAKFKALWETAYDEIEEMILYMGYYTMKRRSEIVQLGPASVEFENDRIKVPAGKTNLEHYIHLHIKLKAYLKKWIAEHPKDTLFLPFSPDYLSRVFLRMATRSGAGGSFKWLRSTASSRLAAKNVHPRKIANQLAHTTTDTADRHYISLEIGASANDINNAL